MLSVLLRYTDSDYPFGIFTLFLCASLAFDTPCFGMMFSRLSWNYDVNMLTLCKYIVATNGYIFRSYPVLHLFHIVAPLIPHRLPSYPIPLWYLYMFWYYGTCAVQNMHELFVTGRYAKNKLHQICLKWSLTNGWTFPIACSRPLLLTHSFNGQNMLILSWNHQL